MEGLTLRGNLTLAWGESKARCMIPPQNIIQVLANMSRTFQHHFAKVWKLFKKKEEIKQMVTSHWINPLKKLPSSRLHPGQAPLPKQEPSHRLGPSGNAKSPQLSMLSIELLRMPSSTQARIECSLTRCWEWRKNCQLQTSTSVWSRTPKLDPECSP